jgi:hypothetical protein
MMSAINAMIQIGCDALQNPAHEEEETGHQGQDFQRLKT